MADLTNKAWALDTFGANEPSPGDDLINALKEEVEKLQMNATEFVRTSMYQQLTALNGPKSKLVQDKTWESFKAVQKALTDCRRNVDAERGFADRRRKKILVESNSMHEAQMHLPIKDTQLAATLKEIAGHIANDPSNPMDLDSAEGLLAKVRTLVQAHGALAKLPPEQAKAASISFEALQEPINGVTVTREMLDKARTARFNGRKQVDAVQKQLNELRQKPPEQETDKPAWEGAVAKLEKELLAAQSDAGEANADFDKLDALKTQQEEAQAAALKARETLSEAISFGRLAPDNARPFKPQTATKLIAAFAFNPALGTAAMETASDLTSPDHVADNVEGLAALIGRQSDAKRRGDPSVANPEKYACDLLRMGGHMGPDYFANMGAYLKTDRATMKDPLGEGPVPRNATPNQRMQQRSMALSRKMLAGDGTLVLGTETAQNAVADSLFHPDAVKDKMVCFAQSTVQTVSMLQQKQVAANKVLSQATVPSAGGIPLIRAATGKTDPIPLDAQDVRVSVVASMLKPVDQGNVGSCFATGPVRKMRDAKPMEMMGFMVEIASTGQLTPNNRVPVPAVERLPDGEDPVLRSLEYTVANAAADSQNSSEKKKFTANIGNATSDLAGGLFSSLPFGNSNQSRINAELSQRSRFGYDPTSATESASDGSSSQGRFVLAIDGMEIRDRDSLVACLKRVAQQTLGTMDEKEMKRLDELCKSESFLKKLGSDNYKPWELASGGFGKIVMQAMYPGKQGGVTEAPLVSATLAGSASSVVPEFMSGAVSSVLNRFDASEGSRMTGMLKGMLDAFGGKGEDMILMETKGMHDFNALPNHPSLQPLKADRNGFENELIKKGKAMANKQIPTEKAMHLFDRKIAPVFNGRTPPDIAEEVQNLAAKLRPTGPVLPAELNQSVQQALSPYHDYRAEDQTQDWAQEQTNKGKTVTTEARTKKLQELKQEGPRATAGELKAQLLKDMGGPEFVFADTNWGDATTHIFFVIAPDPTTGEPMLWKRNDPPGTLSVPEPKWAQANWCCFN